MNFHTGTEILLSVLYAFLFGIFGGLLKTAIYVMFQYVETLASLPRSIMEATESRAAFKSSFKKLVGVSCSDSKVVELLSDFLFTLLYGIFFGLLLYVAVDGVFRFYILLISVGTTYLCTKTLSRAFKKIFTALLRVICTVIVNSVIIVIYPARTLLKHAVKLTQNLDKHNTAC